MVNNVGISNLELTYYTTYDSKYDGRIVFEHVGCEANPWYIANHKTSKV